MSFADSECWDPFMVLLRGKVTHEALDATGKCSWTVIEPAIEVLSACLPTMAPFLNIRTHLNSLRSTLRSLFSSHKDSRSQQSRTNNSSCQFRVIDKAYENHILNLNAECETNASATLSHQQVSSDQIPLKAIVIRHDLAWEEESR